MGVEMEVGTLEMEVEMKVEIEPTCANASLELANALMARGSEVEAIAAFERAIRLDPMLREAHCSLGTLLQHQGDLAGAKRCYMSAIRLWSNEPNAWSLLGSVLRESGELLNAVACYREALRLKPETPEFYSGLGHALKEGGRHAEAIEAYTNALRMSPVLQAAQGELVAGVEQERRQHQRDDRVAKATDRGAGGTGGRSAGGAAAAAGGGSSLAAATCATSCEIGSAPAAWTLGLRGETLPTALKELSRALVAHPWLPEAVANLVHTRQFVCDWRARDSDMALVRTLLEAQLLDPRCCPAIQPFHTLAYPFPCELTLRLSRSYARHVSELASQLASEAPHLDHPARDGSVGTPGARRLRVGYVSSDFLNHPLAHLMKSVFGFHERSRFEIFCYSLRASDGSCFRCAIEAGADHFRESHTPHSSHLSHTHCRQLSNPIVAICHTPILANCHTPILANCHTPILIICHTHATMIRYR